MPLMKWNDSFSVGHPKLDIQHQELVSILNLLFDALQDGQPEEVRDQILDRLVKYTQEHFSYEEQEMQRVDYPDLADHKREHESLMAKVNDFVIAFSADASFQYPKMMTFLKAWLVRHIQQSDKACAPYFSNVAV